MVKFEIKKKTKREYFKIILELFFLNVNKEVSNRHLEFLVECILLVHKGYKEPLSTSNKKRIARMMNIKPSNLYTIISNCRAEGLIPKQGETIGKTFEDIANLKLDELDYLIKIKFEEVSND